MGQIPIANGFYQYESLPVSNQRCVNLYPVIPQGKSLTEGLLIGTPGILQLTTSGETQQVNRGSWAKNGIPYVVNGTTLYSVDYAIDEVGVETFSMSALGTIEGTGRVSMANSPIELVILVPGGKGYVYNEGAATPFEEITDADFRANGNPMYVVYVDGYFVYTTDENKIISSNLNQGLVYDALDFGSAESDPDNVRAPVVVNNQLYITGVITTEENRNIGGSGFPFQRTNVFLDKGCVAPFSIVKANQTFYMIGRGEKEAPAVWQFSGTQFSRKSTDAIDVLLQRATKEDLENAFGMYYARRGNFFVIFTFGNKTLAFDLVTEKWHERETTLDSGVSRGREASGYEESYRWRVNSIVSAYNRLIVGDSFDGRIGELTTLEFSEYGGSILSYFTLQPFFSEVGIAIPKLEMTMESGVGNDICPDPQVSMSKSEDGKVFNGERLRGIGKKGEFNRRIVWRRNGRSSRMLVLRFACSDMVKKVFIRLDAE